MDAHHLATLPDAPHERGARAVEPVAHRRAKHEADGRFPRCAEQNRVAERDDPVEVFEHLEIVLRFLREAKARVEQLIEEAAAK